MSRAKTIPKDELEKAITDRLSQDELCQKFQVTPPTLLKNIKEHGLFELRRSLSVQKQYARTTSPGFKAKISAKSRAKWTEPEFRAKMSEAIKNNWTKDEYREKMHESRVESWKNDPDRRAKTSAQSTERWQDPEHREKVSNSLKEMWAEPEFRAKMEVILGSEEHRAKLASIARRLWSDPQYRDKMAEAHRTDDYLAMFEMIRQDPEFQKKIASYWTPEARSARSRLSKQRWEDPEFRRRMTQILSDPNVKAKQSDNMRRYWLENRSRLMDVFRSTRYRGAATARAISLWRDPQHKEKMMAILTSPKSLERLAHVRSTQPKTMTLPHTKVCHILTDMGVQFEVEKCLGPWSFDVFVPSQNLLIEIQGDYWHSRPKQLQRDAAKQTYISTHFPQYRLKYVWEHEALAEELVLNRLRYWLGIDIKQRDFNFDELAIIQPEIKEADQFLYTYHYQHHGKHGIDFAGYLDGQIVVLARFSHVTREEIATSMGYSSSEVLELTRLCAHPSYQKSNLLPWFLARCEGTLTSDKPSLRALVSFADTTHGHTGAVYRASNWTFVHATQPDYNYVSADGWVMRKKTLYRHARSLGLTEREFAESRGYIKSFGKSKLKFIKKVRP